jgi:hypothetical protein
MVRVIKSRGMRWVGLVALVGERRSVYRVLVGKPGGKRTLGSQDVGWRTMLRWMFRK